jgi:hypothetical protein
MSKHKTHFGIKDAYLYYEDTSDTPISYSVFTQIIKEFYKEISNMIIFNTFEFRMPYRLGRLRIRKYKPKIKVNADGTIDKSRLFIDYASTKKLWSTNEEAKENKKLVFHLNDHTNGYQHRWFWEKRTSNIPNHSAYCFIPSRFNKRTLAKALKDEDIEIDFFE